MPAPPTSLHVYASLALVLAAVAARGAEPEPRWAATGTIAAPEAHQAAAAEGGFVYAIASEQIAQYDRKTGERLALSRGPAKHLNSGFFWRGKLYCAHSNYPRKPERSEILVLDPQSMELTTFKEFGNYGGSLTWCVQHAGHWWCCFARYRDENAGTFLVKFDETWQEKGRWTCPRELIAQLGQYSLSGGVWREGELLVTGHDDRVLFRLRLPAAGTTLELLGTIRVPFTGQGIAHDPQTGGLVGIDRGKKQIIFAAPPRESPSEKRENRGSDR